MGETIKTDILNWAKKPYRENGTIIDWLLFIGLLTCGSILWTGVVKRLTD